MRYLQSGVGAPPYVLRRLIKKRKWRAEIRFFSACFFEAPEACTFRSEGLKLLNEVVSCISFPSAVVDALLFLRQSLVFQPPSLVSSSLETTSKQFLQYRTHYTMAISGCGRNLENCVTASFHELYQTLASMIMSYMQTVLGGSSSISSNHYSIIVMLL